MTATIPRLWHKQRLPTRLVLASLFCTVITGLGLLGHQVSDDTRQHSEALKRHAAEEMESMIPAVADQALIGDYTAIQQIADRFAGHANVVLAQWQDGHGNVLSATGEVVDPDIPAPFKRWIGLGDVTATAPVMIGGRQYGTVTLRAGAGAIERQIWKTLVGNALILALACVGQAGLSVLVLRRSMAALMDLDTAARHMEAGDFEHRLAPHGSPEIRHLMQTFNNMSQAIGTANRSLLISLGDVAAAHRELTRFSEILTHHFQEPVRQILSFANNLARGGPDDEFGSRAFISEAAQRLRTLLADTELYLALSHLPTANHAEAAEAAVTAALSRLAAEVAQTGARIEVGPLPEVWLDKYRLTVLFKELIGNALEYRRPDTAPLVRIEAAMEGAFARFRVSDNGIGIDSEYFERIFVVFSRLHTRQAHPGNGIGLSIVQKIVLAAGGEISVESTPGVGSTFAFTLPLHPPKASLP